MKWTFIKRNSRSEVILDEDDLFLLNLLNTKTLCMGDIAKKMNFSAKASIVHVNRLSRLSLVNIFRFRPPKQQSKLVAINKKGRRILKIFKNAGWEI